MQCASELPLNVAIPLLTLFRVSLGYVGFDPNTEEVIVSHQGTDPNQVYVLLNGPLCSEATDHVLNIAFKTSKMGTSSSQA